MTNSFDTFVNDMLSQWDTNEVKTGLEVEKEHDDVTHGDKLKRAKIVKAHLEEVPNYYAKLKKYVEPKD